jgi:hypothetical protein
VPSRRNNRTDLPEVRTDPLATQKLLRGIDYKEVVDLDERATASFADTTAADLSAMFVDLDAVDG